MKVAKAAPLDDLAPAAPAARPRLRWLLLLALAAAGAGGAYAAWSFRPGDPDALWARAQEEFTADRPDRAEALLDRRDRVRPPGGEQFFLRAQVAGSCTGWTRRWGCSGASPTATAWARWPASARGRSSASATASATPRSHYSTPCGSTPSSRRRGGS